MAHIGKTQTCWVVPDATKDTPEEFIKFSKSRDDVDGLLALGLVEETTNIPENAEIVNAIRQANQRDVRVVSLTTIGFKMFQHLDAPGNKLLN